LSTNLFERLLSRLFPPAKLSELGKIDTTTSDYLYRKSRTGIERNPGVFSMYVKVGSVVEHPAKPVPRHGTRESRAAIQS
jgi:hypothetical protein